MRNWRYLKENAGQDAGVKIQLFYFPCKLFDRSVVLSSQSFAHPSINQSIIQFNHPTTLSPTHLRPANTYHLRCFVTSENVLLTVNASFNVSSSSLYESYIFFWSSINVRFIRVAVSLLKSSVYVTNFALELFTNNWKRHSSWRSVTGRDRRADRTSCRVSVGGDVEAYCWVVDVKADDVVKVVDGKFDDFDNSEMGL